MLKSSVSLQLTSIQEVPQTILSKSKITMKPEELDLIFAFETDAEGSIFPAFSPDGQLLITTSENEEIRLWGKM